MRKFLLLTCTFSFFLFPFSFLCYAQDKIVAVVNNEVITSKDLNDFLNFMRLQMSTEYKGKDLETRVQSMKLNLLERLIEDRLILQEAKKNKIQVDINRVKARIEEIKKKYSSDTQFQEALLAQGLVQADLEEKIQEQLLMYGVIELLIKKKILINPNEITDFYAKNKDEFRVPEQREFEVIAAENEIVASQVYKELKAGTTLEDLSKKYTLQVHKFKARMSELKPDIAEAIFSLYLGEISKPIKTESGFSLFKIEHIIVSRYQGINEVQDDIHNYLFEKKMQESMLEWLDGLKKRSYIKISPD